MSDAEVRRYRFNLPKFTERKFAPYALAIGQATLAWNELHEHLGRLFGLLLDTETRDPGFAVWQSMISDRGKREALLALLDTIQPNPKFPRLAQDVKWCVDEATCVEDTRNNTVHGPLQLVAEIAAFEGEPTAAQVRQAAKVGPHHWGKNTRAKRLVGKDLIAEYRWCRDRSLQIRNVVSAIDEAIERPPSPWPQIPRKLAREGSKTHKLDRPPGGK